MNDEPRLCREPRGGVPEVIDAPEEFIQCCERFAAASGPLAADAERASGFRYGHDDWLVQFKREGAGIALIDPVALRAMGMTMRPFAEAVSDAQWVAHDATQDLPGYVQLDLIPQSLFDTMVAARLLGLPRVGLSSVTEHVLGLALAKEHSAADWSYRPLPRDWRNYAALDVELLLDLRERMARELRRQGKEDWAREEFAHVLRKGLTPKVRHSDPWVHLSHINELHHDRRALAVARELWMQRDALAREHDIEPTLLLSDAAILEAAKRKPHNIREFRAIRSLNERVRISLGDGRDKMFARYAPIQRSIKSTVWKQAIQRALALPDEQCPSVPSVPFEPTINAPRSMALWRQSYPERYERLQAVKRVINQIAQDTSTPADVLIKSRYLRNLCWQEHPARVDVEEFLLEQGARAWQVKLLAASVTRAIM